MTDFAGALRAQWPHARAGVVDGIIAVYDKNFTDFDINSPLIVCHFMAQLSQECGQGRITRESLYYTTVARLMEVFGVGHHSAKITQEEAPSLLRNEVALAERVYGLGNPKKAKELGNTKPGDGYKYRGNGFMQLTGRGSHIRIGQLVGLDLEGDPGLLDNAGNSFRVACCEFKDLGAIAWAEKDDVRAVTKKVNGGTNGLAERTVFLKHWKECLDGIEAPAWKPRAAPDADQPTFLSSKITQAGIGTGVMTGISTVSQLADSLGTTTDTVQQVGENVKKVTVIVKPLLGIDIHIWANVAGAAAFLSMIGVIVVLWQRYKKLRDQGV